METVRMRVNEWIRERVDEGDMPGLEVLVDLDPHFMRDPASIDPADRSGRALREEYTRDRVQHNAEGMEELAIQYARQG